MIVHIVMWKLKQEASGRTKEENALLIKAGLEALNGVIDGLIDIEAGIGIDMPGSTWDIVLVSKFESQQYLDSYQQHPKHLEVGAIIKESAESRQAVDYET